MRLRVKNVIPSLVLFYPAIYILCCMLSIELLFSRLTLLLSILALIRDAIKQGSNSTNSRLWLLYLFVLIIINAMFFGLSYIFHVDCYGLIQMLTIFSLYQSEERLERLKSIMQNERNGRMMLFSFYSVLLCSIIFFNGTKISTGWGLSIPILYGPYSVSHNIAYQVIIVYAVASYYFHNTGKRSYLFIMILSTLMCVWTAARSGLLAMAVVIMIDYFSERKVSIKAMIAIVAIAIIGFLGLFTDVLISNPIVQKTLISAESGSITNGRELFPAYIMNYYLTSTTTTEKIFGISLYRIRALMKIRWFVDIHAHNDFVNVLAGFGVYGLIGYIVSIIQFSKKAIKWISLITVLLILSWFNGLYMYVSFVPATPVLIIYFRDLFFRRGKHSKKLRANS